MQSAGKFKGIYSALWHNDNLVLTDSFEKSSKVHPLHADGTRGGAELAE